MLTTLLKFKNWVHEITRPEYVDKEGEASSKYSTSERTEPIIVAMELAMIPRLPAKPVDCTDQEFEEVLEAIRTIWKGKVPRGSFIYYPRQRELYVQFPQEEVHVFQ